MKSCQNHMYGNVTSQELTSKSQLNHEKAPQIAGDASLKLFSTYNWEILL